MTQENTQKMRPVYFEVDEATEIIHGVAVLRVFNSETQAEEVMTVNLRNPIKADKIGLLRMALLQVERFF